MGERQLSERRLARRGEFDQDLTMIILATPCADQATLLDPPDQLLGGVVGQLQALGSLGDCRLSVGWQTADGQQQLVVLRLEPGRARCAFREVHETPNAIPQLGEHAVFIGRQLSGGGGHGSIVSRYNFVDVALVRVNL
jgi:hypothetical protein